MRLPACIMAFVLILAAAPAAAQTVDGFDFGDNDSPFAFNDQCDDPRFTGEGMASILIDSDVRQDAADCAAAFKAGTITLRPGPEAAAAAPGAINFGDDAGSYAHNLECDDKRFTGQGMAAILLDKDMGHDASDCRARLESGSITYAGLPGWEDAGSDRLAIDAIDFGDNGSTFANNGACDDKRFSGPGMASILLGSDMRHDANDCRSAYAVGTIRFLGTAVRPEAAAGIDFGDDAGSFAHNGECDDGRFEGPGMADFLIDSDIGHDAADCGRMIDEGMIVYVGLADGADGDDEAGDPAATGRSESGEEITIPEGLDFGDDESSWANNDICDDRRFDNVGEGDVMSLLLLGSDVGHDASDCRAAFLAGTIRLAD